MARAKLVPFNEIEGIASSNVPAYSNRNSSFFNVGRHYLYGVFTGYQWQCVEYARRWLLMRKGCIFKDIPCACNMWDQLTYIERVTDARRFPLRAVSNGSSEAPKSESLLIYPRSVKMPYGHVAIITHVDSNYVYIAEQNNFYHFWPGNYARREPLRFENGQYYIDDKDSIFGWMEIGNIDELTPLDESKSDTILEQYLNPQSKGLFRRLFTTDKRADAK